MPHPNLDRFLQLTQLLAPAILLAVPKGEKIAPFLPVVIGAINTVEQFPGSTSAEKRALALELTRAGIEILNRTKRTSVDIDEVLPLVGQGIDLTIATIHLVHGMGDLPSALPAVAPPGLPTGG